MSKEAEAQKLCDFWCQKYMPNLGVNRRNGQVTEKARSSGIYKHNLESLAMALEGGYSDKEIVAILRDAYAQDASKKFIRGLFPLPKQARVFQIDPSEMWVHPLFYEDGKLRTSVRFDEVLDYLLITAGIPEPEFFRPREERNLHRLLGHFSLDEVLYMAEAASNRSDTTVDNLYFLTSYLKEARKMIAQKEDMIALVEETLNRSMGRKSG